MAFFNTSAPVREAPDDSAYPKAPQPPPYLPFVKLLALERLDTGTEKPSGLKYEYFRSRYGPMKSGDSNIVFGGYIFAHAAYAASMAVDRGMFIHNVTGSFTASPSGSIPFTFRVRHMREGRTYCLRAVEVRQKEEICFTSFVSFKRVEGKYHFLVQPKMEIEKRYKIVLDGIKKENHPWTPALDVPWWNKEVERGERSPVPLAGMDIRKVKMERYNDMAGAGSDPLKYRQLHFYRMFGLPGNDEWAASQGDGDGALNLETLRFLDNAGEFDNLYICAHLFASDRDSVFTVAYALKQADRIKAITSLSHSVIIHAFGPAIRMIDWHRLDQNAGAGGTAELGEGKGRKWFSIEARTSRAGENRVMYQGQIWGPDGTLVATSMQDALLRVTEKAFEAKL